MSTLREENGFRLTSISIYDVETQTFDTMPVSYGLGVEYKLEDGSYIVIAFVKPAKDNCVLEVVGERLQEYITKYNYDIFISLVKDAFRFVKICNGQTF